MGRRNFLAARGLPMAEVVDWYLLHIQTLLAPREDAAPPPRDPALQQVPVMSQQSNTGEQE